VTIESINTHLEQGKAVEPAIIDGAQQIALPKLVSTVAICIVFVPMFMLAVLPDTSSCHSPKPSYSRCWRPTSCR